MPSHPCRHPTCTNYVKGSRYCPEHAHLAPLERREQHRIYDLYRRDPESKKFYDSAEWKRSREMKLNANPLCELCQRFAEHVHHKIPVKEATREQRLEQRFLMSVCAECHGRLEAEANAHVAMYVVTGLPGSGKTHWVERRRRPGDAVWDTDEVAAAVFRCPRYPRPAHVVDGLMVLRDAFLSYATAKCKASTYVIVSDVADAKTIAEQMNAQLIHLQVAEEERHRRLSERASKADCERSKP